MATMSGISYFTFLVPCFILFNENRMVESQSIREVNFYYTDHNSVLPYEPQRYIDPGTTGIINKQRCATISVETNAAIGFLYHHITGLCTPISGLATYGSGGARAVDQAQEGDLYLNTKCPSGFSLHATDEAVVCLRISLSPEIYSAAATMCDSWGSHLVMIKTMDKLDLVKSLSPATNLWIGLDDLDYEDVFVWYPDGTLLTSGQRNTLFMSGEPSNSNNLEHCGHVSDQGLLNDYDCNKPLGFACEKIIFQ